MTVSEKVAGGWNKVLLGIRHPQAVPTPVWFGIGSDGRVYLRSEANVGRKLYEKGADATSLELGYVEITP